MKVHPERVALSIARLQRAQREMTAALAALDAMQPGWPSSASGASASVSGGGGSSSIVERLALGRTDEAQAALDSIEQIVDTLDGSSRRLLDLVLAWAPLARPTAQLARDTIRNAGCRSCSRIEVFSKVAARQRCDWCYSFLSNHGIDPPVAILRKVKIDHERLTEQEVRVAVAAVKRARRR